LPAQSLLRSETLAAMFQFGLREAALFLALLAPLAAALSAVMMAIAIRCKSFKEAQANNTVVILGVSLLPLVTVFNQSGEAAWHLAVPALGQVALMNRVLKGEGVGPLDMGLAFAVCAIITAAGLAYIARHLRTAATR
jgi:sodium transport system permease protein